MCHYPFLPPSHTLSLCHPPFGPACSGSFSVTHLQKLYYFHTISIAVVDPFFSNNTQYPTPTFLPIKCPCLASIFKLSTSLLMSATLYPPLNSNLPTSALIPIPGPLPYSVVNLSSQHSSTSESSTLSIGLSFPSKSKYSLPSC